jgi:3-deoxy-D-manno-octulosonate 8-phosphate phosphatase (KDO 8-P phosphatase)
MVVLSEIDAVARARSMRLLLTDVDGVLTDGGAYYSQEGEELKRFSLRDGMGVALLKSAGVMTGFLSGERSAAVRQRAIKLGLEHVYLGVDDKHTAVLRLCNRLGIGLHELGFIGDDVNDLAALERIGAHGLTAAPMDAEPCVLDVVHYRTQRIGGHGAFRDFANHILKLRSS